MRTGRRAFLFLAVVIGLVAAVDMLVGSIRRRSVMEFFRRSIYWGLAGAAGLGLMLSLGGLSWPSLVAAIIVVFLVRGVFYVVDQNQLRLRWTVAVLLLLAVTIGGAGLWTGAWNTTSTKAFIASTFASALTTTALAAAAVASPGEQHGRSGDRRINRIASLLKNFQTGLCRQWIAGRHNPVTRNHFRAALGKPPLTSGTGRRHDIGCGVAHFF